MAQIRMNRYPTGVVPPLQSLASRKLRDFCSRAKRRRYVVSCALVLLLLGGRSHLPVVFLGAATVRFFEGGGFPDALIFGTPYTLSAYLSFFIFLNIIFLVVIHL